MKLQPGIGDIEAALTGRPLMRGIDMGPLVRCPRTGRPVKKAADLLCGAPTICATGHINLVEATGHDILFRMLEDYELGAAMGFDPELVKYEFTGNKTEKVKQIGNAVPVELADACVTALFSDQSERVEFMEAAE